MISNINLEKINSKIDNVELNINRYNKYINNSDNSNDNTEIKKKYLNKINLKINNLNNYLNQIKNNNYKNNEINNIIYKGDNVINRYNTLIGGTTGTDTSSSTSPTKKPSSGKSQLTEPVKTPAPKTSEAPTATTQPKNTSSNKSQLVESVKTKFPTGSDKNNIETQLALIDSSNRKLFKGLNRIAEFYNKIFGYKQFYTNTTRLMPNKSEVETKKSITFEQLKLEFIKLAKMTEYFEATSFSVEVYHIYLELVKRELIPSDKSIQENNTNNYYFNSAVTALKENGITSTQLLELLGTIIN